MHPFQKMVSFFSRSRMESMEDRRLLADLTEGMKIFRNLRTWGTGLALHKGFTERRSDVLRHSPRGGRDVPRPSNVLKLPQGPHEDDNTRGTRP